MSEPYYPYSQYLKNIYGEKVYKLPINLPGTCPNRDGTCGTGGCHFCSEKGTGFESMSNTIGVEEQLTSTMGYIGKRYGAKKFIAYFQNYTNTYMAYDQFQAYMEAACIKHIVELDVSTRPDCIDEGHLDILKKIKETKGVEIVIELGLQSTNEESLIKINRGHTVDDYIRAVELIHSYGFAVCTHLIMNLPWDADEEMCKMASLMNQLNMEMVKCHSLYIAKGTVFEKQYIQGDFKMNTLENYVDRVCDFLYHLDQGIAVQRLVGRAPKEDTVFCNWGVSWWKIKDFIVEKMLKDGRLQGTMVEGENS